MRAGGSVAACGLAPQRYAASGVLFFTLLVLPLFGHGCHRDDLDHEPSAAPPVVAHEADPKTS